MSSLVDRFQEPIFAATAVIFVIISAVMYFTTDIGWPVIIIIAGLASGGLYLAYNDIVERRRLEDAEKAKTDDLKRRIEHQVQVEQESGKCISCTAEIPDGADKCPNCGYKVKHYSSVEN